MKLRNTTAGDQGSTRFQTRWGLIRQKPEAGSALIEFLALAFLMLIPVMFLVITLGRIQAGSFAADTAVRSGTRAFITSPDDATAALRAQVAVELAFADQGFDNLNLQDAVQITCTATPCLTPGELVTLELRTRIPIPGIPGFIGSDDGVGVNLHASHTMLVDRYSEIGKWGRP